MEKPGLDWTSRAYRGPADLQELVSLLPRVREPERLSDYPSPIDLREILALPANQARARLWLDGQRKLAGFGMVDQFDNVLFEAIADHDVALRYGEILHWAESACLLGRDTAKPITLDAIGRSDDASRIRALVDNGYRPTGAATLTLARDLGEPLPAIRSPDGWTVRPLRGEQEVQAVVALHRAAFGTEHLTLEERLSWMRAPHYLPALDLVLETDAGDLAGYCMCGIEREANEITRRRRGYTDPVAVHPRHQGQGAARALLAHGMRLLARCGMTEAVIHTSSENARMLRVARSLGHILESTRAWYPRKILPPAARQG